MRNIKAADWGRAIEPIHQKMSAASQAILAMSPGTAAWKTRDYHGYAKEGYTQSEDTHACISLLTTAMKGVPVYAFTQDGEGNEERIETGPIVDLLNRPNPQQGWSQFIEAIGIHLLTAGNTYIERSVGTSFRKAPLELYTQRPDRIEIVKGDPSNPIRGFRYVPLINPSGDVQWPADFISGRGMVQRILHAKFFNPTDDWYGLSPIEIASKSIDTISEAQLWNFSMLKNGMRPSGILSSEGIMDEDVRLRMETSLKAKSGAGSAGSSLLFEGGKIDWKQLSVNPVDMSWMEGQREATRRICAVVKVPPQLIGDEAAKTYANFEEAHRAFWMLGVLPLMDMLIGELNHWLCPFFGDNVALKYDKSAIEAIQEDEDLIHNRALAAYLGGGITLNEYRKRIGEDDMGEAGNILLIPSTVMPTPVKQLQALAQARVTQVVSPPKPTIAPQLPPGRKPNARLQ